MLLTPSIALICPHRLHSQSPKLSVGTAVRCECRAIQTTDFNLLKYNPTNSGRESIEHLHFSRIFTVFISLIVALDYISLLTRSLFICSLAFSRFSSDGGFIMRKVKLSLLISKVKHPISSSEASLHSSGYSFANSVSLFLRLVLNVDIVIGSFASLKYISVVFCHFFSPVLIIAPFLI